MGYLSGLTGLTGRHTPAKAREDTPHRLGTSVAIGLFIAALPTPGLDTITLAAIAWKVPWANAWAFGLSLAILNPIVKGGVYVASFALGSLILGSTGGTAELSVSAGPTVLSRLVLGNLILAFVIAGAGYGIAYWTTRRPRVTVGLTVLK